MLVASALLLWVVGFLPVASARGPPKVIAIRQDQAGQPSSLSAAATTATAAAAASSASSTTSPAEILDPFNITLDGQIFPPSNQVGSADLTKATDYTINCLDCSINATLGLSAGGKLKGFKPVEAPPDVQEIPSSFDFQDYWVAATFDNLDAVFDFSIDLNASSNANNEIKVPIPLGKANAMSRTIGILTLNATLSAEIHGWINTTNDVNLTYGFEFSVPPGSEILVDLSNNNATSLGFNEAKLTPIPLNSTRSDLEIDLELSFRPSISLTVAVDATVADASIALTVDLDVPKLDVDIMQVHNVTSDCKPITSSTPADQIYSNLTMVVPSVGFDASEVFQGSGSFLGEKVSVGQPHEQGLPNINLTTACLFYDAAKKALTPPTEIKTKVSSAMGFHPPPFAVAALLIMMTVVFALM